MAKNYTEILALANKNNMGLSNTIKRDYGIPLDYSSVQENYEAALNYAKTSTLAYIGQPISVGDVLYVVTTAENGYLKQVGVKPVGDEKSIEVSEEGVVSICGFEAAGEATLPRKNSDGSISWITLADIAGSTDTNTKTVVAVAEDSAITVSYSYDEETDTRTYTLDVQLPAIPEYSVEKVEGENEVTYKVTKDGVQVGESIVVPNAFDATEILESIETLEGYFTAGEANVAVEAKGYVADGAIDAEFKRLAGLIDGLAGVDTGFTKDLEELEKNFKAFMEGTGVEDVIDTLADIKAAIERLQSHTSIYEEKVDKNVEDIEEIKGRLDVVEAIEHHEHANKAELDKIIEGDVEKWNSLANYNDSEVRELINGLNEAKADKSYVEEELAKKVDAEGYVAYSEEEKAKLAGLENYNDSELCGRVSEVEGYFAEGIANDAAKLGGQLPEYYASKASVEEAIAGVHNHENKDVLDGISSTDIENWNAAEQNAKSYSDSKLGEAVESLDGKITAEKERAEGIEAGFESRIGVLEAKEPTKVEASEANGNIKVDGQEVKVYDDAELVSRLEAVEGKPFDTYAIKAEVEEALAGKVNNETLTGYYTIQETLDKIEEKIKSFTGGESAADVKIALENYEEINDARVKAVEDKNVEQDAAIKANADAIEVLNGSGEGSVAKQVAEAIAEVVAEAPEAFDTLKEIADYIAGDKTNAAELLNKVNANSEAIAAEAKRAGEKEVELAGLISDLDAAYKAVDESLVAEDERLASLIKNNLDAIAVLNGDAEGSVNKKIADAIAAIPSIPAATASTLGLVKVGETMSVDAEGTINVAKVSTDILVNGEKELILVGGSAE